MDTRVTRMKKILHKIIDQNLQRRQVTQRRTSTNLAACWSWKPAAWIFDDRAGGNSHTALTDSQFRIFTSARSYDKTYNLASPKSKSYHRIRLIFCRLHSNIIILAPARSSKNSTSLYRAAGGGTQDANYAVPERTSPTY